jgi:SNF family Na+-dependent transporter
MTARPVSLTLHCTALHCTALHCTAGGSFLIPYLVMLLLVGLPAFFMELTAGQYARWACTALHCTALSDTVKFTV